MYRVAQNIPKNKMETKQLVVMAMFAAISIVFVSIIHFPIFPLAPFLEYDPADIPILICTFAYGPTSGFILTLIVSLIQGFTVSSSSGIIGIIMHIVATGSCAIITGNIYYKNKTKKSAIIALIVGMFVMTAAMAGMNLILTPIFMDTPIDVVIPMILPIIVPFNLLKSGINCFVTFILYKSISNVLKRY